MTLTFSHPIRPRTRGDGRAFSVQSFDLLNQGLGQSPIVMFDDFHVRGHPFGPHPHAGFSAVTYVFDDSSGALRSRDSLGNDHVVGPGGIVWTQAADGVMHEEMLADPALELHGLQFFVNLTGGNKAIPPEVFALDADAVPVWTGTDGDRVHVVVGDYDGTASPLRPAEPFSLLDIELVGGVKLTQAENWFGLIYARYDAVEIVHAGGRTLLPAGMAMTAEGAGQFRLQPTGAARPLFLAGPLVDEAVLQHGPFIMREPAEIDAAVVRYQKGQMGRLAPYRGA
jgi:redox-sensitive bicupin YhaK (pirin superfamily)